MSHMKKKKRYKPKPLLHIRFLILIFALLFIFIMMYKNVHIMKGQIVDDPSITGYERNAILIQKEYNLYSDSNINTTGLKPLSTTRDSRKIKPPDLFYGSPVPPFNKDSSP